MAQRAAIPESETESEAPSAPGGARGSRRWIGLALIAVVAAGGIAAYVLGVFHKGANDPSPAMADDAGPAKEAEVFYDLPEMLVNLNAPRHSTIFLKLQATLELGSEAYVDRAENVSPRIVDDFQSYLREQRASELNGSAGISRLRANLIARAEVEMWPTPVKDVLFKELIVQ